MSVLEALKYLLLGLVQGVTEVLPISSSGHVEFVKALVNLDYDEGLLFLILVNSGSLVTFLFVYRRKLARLIIEFIEYIFKKESRPVSKNGFFYVLKLGVASIPAAIVGFLFSDLIDSIMLEYNVLVSGVGLLFTGTVLFLVGKHHYHNGINEITWVNSVLIGTAQAVALIPGISRSGMTTSTGLKRGASIDSTLDFSFLMYIPISIGSLLLFIKEGIETGMSVPSNAYYFYYILAFSGALVATFVAFKIIFNIFRTGKLKYFGIYCLVLGLLSIAVFISR